MKFIVFLGLLNACSLIGGNFSDHPASINDEISPATKSLLAESFKDIKEVHDVHTHIVGLGKGGTGAYINPEMQSFWHPFKSMKFYVYKSGSGIKSLKQSDQEYVARLLKLLEHTQVPFHSYIMAFDKHYRKNGDVDERLTEFYTPNEYVMKLSRKHSKYFTPTISIHPYKPDALKELENYAQQGVRIVKWLPNAMGMDPADASLIPYYQIMKKYNMTLLTHVGEEQAVEADEHQGLGNPLKFRLALDQGVRVVMAHCASLGMGVDYDHPEQKKVTNFKLFLRMMENPKYKELLYGEISAITHFNRFEGVLDTLLARKDLHPRLIYGSDYPLPAINIIIRTKDLHKAGYISKEVRESLNEIYYYNPLLFDFVLKRVVKHPQTEAVFSPSIFGKPDFL